jgi:hypothetical protein
MAGPNNNVVVLTPFGTGKTTAISQGVARAAVGQLDGVCRCLRELSPSSTWSAPRWMIASTPFRMQLTAMRQRLDDLATISVDDEQNAIRWVLELTDARFEAERRLHDIRLSLQSLQHPEIRSPERIRETELFTAYKLELLKALKNLQRVIAKRFPAALDDG